MGVLATALASVAFLHGGNLVVVDPATGAQQVVLRHASGPVRWSGDGRLVSAGARIAGGPALPAARIEWAPAGETAAYQTTRGAVLVWSPAGGSRVVVPASWGARSFAWGTGGRIALGRHVERPGAPNRHEEVWIWRAGTLRRVAGPLSGDRTPLVEGFAPDGRVLWWDDLFDSASVAADGLLLSADRTPFATTLLFPDFVVRCGRSLALVAGGDRNTMHGKRILVGGRDVSHDRSRSWVSPACSPDGSVVVAAAGRESASGPWGREHRAIWRLLPSKRQLTRPPSGWTDEFPQVLGGGSILFVRTRQTSRRVAGTWRTTTRGMLELLAHGRLRPLADLTERTIDGPGPTPMYYGHYWWPDRVAVAGR